MDPEARQRHQKQSHTLHQIQCSQASADRLHLWNNDTDILRRLRSGRSHPAEAERCILYRRRRRCLRWHILRAVIIQGQSHGNTVSAAGSAITIAFGFITVIGHL